MERNKKRTFNNKGGKEFLPSIQRTQLFKKNSKQDMFLDDPNKSLDYKDISMLTRFVSEKGRILPRRTTGLNAFNQRRMAKSIKRAQSLGLMAFAKA